MIKPIRKLPQVSVNQATGSALERYRNRVVGNVGWGRFLQYELMVTFFVSLGGALGLALRKVLFPSLFKQCGKGVIFGRNITIRQPQKITIGSGTIMDDLVVLDAKSEVVPSIKVADKCILARNARLSTGYYGYVKIDENTIIGDSVTVHGPGGIEIGKNVLIGDGTILNAGKHIYDDREKTILEQGITVCGIKVEEDVWIGAGCRVTDGVTLGKGSVVDAGSVVNDDVPQYSVVKGNPAVVIGQR